MSLSNRIRLKQNGSSDCVTSLRLDWLVTRGVGERHLGRQLNGHIVHNQSDRCSLVTPNVERVKWVRTIDILPIEWRSRRMA